MGDKKPSFEEAMNATLLWCNAWEDGNLSDEVLADRIGELVESRNGARGFLAISLSGDCPLMDRLPDPLVFQLRKSGELVVDLTVKNLAMSTAMAVQHKRKKDKTHLSGSQKIRARCIELLRLLEPNSVKKHLEIILDAINGKGKEVDFLIRWGYDEEQKVAIKSSLNSVATK